MDSVPRSACRDLPNLSITVAIHLVNYSYLSPGRDWGPWLLRIIKSREILQASTRRAEKITHGLFAWTLVLSVPKSRVLWRATLGANTWHFISFCRSTLQSYKIHDTPPRHVAGLYINVFRLPALCFNLWPCIFSGLHSG